MTQTQVTTGDGPMTVQVRGEDADPPVLVLMPAAGVNAALLSVVDRLAGAGYRVLVPELYHRLGEGVTFDPAAQRDEMMAAVSSLTDDEAIADVGALLATLDPNIDVGAVGFCMGGRFVVRAMAAYPDRIVAGAALHPSQLLKDGDDSPHLELARINGPLYVGFGRDDAIVPPEHWSAVDAQATKHGKAVRVEVHPGAGHGYMIPGPHFLASASDASWAGTLAALDALNDA